MKYADLHIHSNYSDDVNPGRIIKIAIKIKLNIFL